MDDTRCYVIEVHPHRTNVEMYWSSKHGWTTFKNADKFTFEESMNLRLPVYKKVISTYNGRWKKVHQWN